MPLGIINYRLGLIWKIAVMLALFCTLYLFSEKSLIAPHSSFVEGGFSLSRCSEVVRIAENIPALL
jgi:hypothetical protein